MTTLAEAPAAESAPAGPDPDDWVRRDYELLVSFGKDPGVAAWLTCYRQAAACAGRLRALRGTGDPDVARFYAAWRLVHSVWQDRAPDMLKL